jgi:dipeptidyl aminopeptidase/acylaminoacyl peptidase
MQGYDYIGHPPEQAYWDPGSHTVYFEWKPDSLGIRQLFAADTIGLLRTLSTKELRTLPGREQVWNHNLTECLYLREGDIYYYNRLKDTTLRLSYMTERVSQPAFTTDGKGFTYQQGGNLWYRSLEEPVLRQLTDIRKGREPTEPIPSSQDDWLERQQEELFQVLVDRKRSREARKALRDNLKDTDLPRRIYTGDEAVMGLRIDPNMRYVTWIQVRVSKPRPTKVPDYVTESGHTAALDSRPKVGYPSEHRTLHIYDRERDTVLAILPDELPGIYDKPAYLHEYHDGNKPWSDRYEKPRPVAWHGPIWSEDGKALLEAKALDNKDRWILLLDPETGKLQTLDHQRDTAWIGGPCIGSWNNAPGSKGWLDEGRRIWYVSEVSGFAHLYALELATLRASPLTAGPWEVLEVQLSSDRGTFYLRANRENPFEQHLYTLPAEGGAMHRISPHTGAYEMLLSPDERWWCIRYSSMHRPWEYYLMPNSANALPVQITHSTTTAFDTYPWRQPEIVHFEASDGAQVPARLYTPDPDKANGGAVLFVHGAGYLQNAHRWWSQYYREYMFHNLLCDQGFTILDVDYRGSSGYGRDWRTAIYRHMGGRDLDDYVDAASWLTLEHKIDPERIGIYGGSYGGFLTLMGLLKYPGTFACGAALRSVTDWAHYNDGYTGNILNFPTTDSLAYRRSSPIYYAENLKDPLLMLHGMVDVNVHFQDVVRLSQRLMELGKDQWELAVYPLEDHGFKESSSWLDEYKRIYRLFTTHLLKE